MGRLVLWIIMGFFVITIAWATLSQIDINATTSGKIIPAGRVKAYPHDLNRKAFHFPKISAIYWVPMMGATDAKR